MNIYKVLFVIVILFISYPVSSKSKICFKKKIEYPKRSIDIPSSIECFIEESTNEIFFYFDNRFDEKIYITVYDENGYVVYDDTKEINNDYQLIIQLDNLKSGKYTLSILYSGNLLEGNFYIH